MSLVTFDDKVNVEFELCHMDHETKSAKIATIKKIGARGSTNLSGGMLAGMSSMEKGRGTAHQITSTSSSASESSSTTTPSTNDVAAARVESVLVFTDGEANVGVQATDGLVALVNDFLTRRDAVNSKCTVYGFGFGAQVFYNSPFVQ